MMQRTWIVALTAVFLLAAPTAGGAGNDDAFVVYKLNVPGRLLQHWVEDLNADGFKDIFIVHRKGLHPHETRWVSIFWQDAGEGFGTAPDQSWELDRDAAILDIGDVSGDLRKEICYLTNTSVRYHPIGEGAYETESVHLLGAQGIAVYPSKRSVPMINFVRDWNGDGKDEVAIAGFEGLFIYSRGADGAFSSGEMIVIELETQLDRVDTPGNDSKTVGIDASYTFPNIQLLDYNNDGLRDLIATTEDRVIVYLQQSDGTYSKTPTTNHLFDVLTQQEKIEGIAEIETLVEDLNVDGYADAVVTKQTAKGLTNFRGVVSIYWGSPNGFGEEPDQLIISEGTASAGARFLDVNGDGRKDLVLPSVKFSVAAIIRILVTRSIKVYFNIFLLNEDDRLSERPDFTKEVKFKIDLSGESDEQAMDLEGDYNGDKRTDFVFATGKDELSVYLGEQDRKDRLFSKKPAAEVGADAYGELSSHDLNDDGFFDMIIYYPENKKLKGTLEVLVNRGMW
jgi:hypothetical protein